MTHYRRLRIRRNRTEKNHLEVMNNPTLNSSFHELYPVHADLVCDMKLLIGSQDRIPF